MSHLFDSVRIYVDFVDGLTLAERFSLDDPSATLTVNVVTQTKN